MPSSRLSRATVDPARLPPWPRPEGVGFGATWAQDGDLFLVADLPLGVFVRESPASPGEAIPNPAAACVALAVDAKRREGVLLRGPGPRFDEVIRLHLGSFVERTVWTGGPFAAYQVKAAWSDAGLLLSRDGALVHLDDEGVERACLRWPKGFEPGRWCVAGRRVVVTECAGKLLAVAVRGWDLEVLGRGTMPKDGGLRVVGEDVFFSSDLSLPKVRWMHLDNLWSLYEKG